MTILKPKNLTILFAILGIGLGGIFTPSTAFAEGSVPDWVKNNALWWAQGLIPVEDYLASIDWLINERIIILAHGAEDDDPIEKKIRYSAGEFRAQFGKEFVTTPASSRASTGALTSVLLAAMHTIPDGARVTNFECYAVDNLDTDNVKCKIIECASDGFACGLRAQTETEVAFKNSSPITFSTPTNFIIDRDVNSYTFEFATGSRDACTSDGRDCAIFGMTITYEVTKAD